MSLFGKPRPVFSCPHSLVLFAPLLLILSSGTAAQAQMGGKATLIENGTILLDGGRTIEKGDVLIMGTQIANLGEKVEASMMAMPKKISAKGKYITAGLVDVWSTIGMRSGPSGRASGNAKDNFDRYADDEMMAAWASGVTVVYVPARVANGFGGTGAVIRLKPNANLEDIVLSENAVLSATIDGAGNQGPLARLRLARELRKAFADAKEYRKAREDYEEELKEYEKKLAEKVKKDAEAAAKDAPAKDAKDGGAKRDGKGPGDRKEGGKPAEPPKQAEPQKPGEPPKEGEKKDELKKPIEPPKDRNFDALLKVLDGELRLRVEANRPEDIANILEVAAEFNIALTIEGGAGAHVVADDLKARDVVVVLGPPPRTMIFSAGPQRFSTEDAFARLRAAGVPVYLGTGIPGGEWTSPNLALRASMCVDDELTSAKALDLITADAARFLGVEKKAGRLAAGVPADVVIWSDHPFAPGARVERVFVAGEEVYKAPKFGGEKKKEKDEEAGEGEE